ncbi:uncharacterized protein LOC132245644 isoform X7 [Alligator mississippiensis]|uniref:uncharacterized protein LOC132245644 isoform X7 n=1 Tax=Alligator mississippiensis TaxID=8496 RepID=UPI002877A855|nr:uncharacterized protein LOC132245644 isoform X7 [Alligator mississippiensis]
MPGSVHRPRAGTQTVLLPEIPCQGQCTRDPQYTMCNAPSPLDLAECGHIQGIWQCCTESQRGKTSSHSRVCWSRLNQGEDEDGGSLGPLNQVTPTRTAQPRLTTSRSNTQMEKWNQRSKVGCPRPQGEVSLLRYWHARAFRNLTGKQPVGTRMCECKSDRYKYK